MKLIIRWRVLLRVLEDAWPAWLLITGIGLAFAIGVWATPTLDEPTLDESVRWTGMLLQVFGLLTVAWGLSKLRRVFVQPSLGAKAVAWSKQLLAAFKTPEPITLEGSLGAYAVMGAEANLVHGVKPGATLEQRLSVAEKNLEELRRELDAKVRRLREEIGAAKQDLQRETHERQAENTKVTRMIEDVTIGGLHLEMVGLVWLMLGVVCTSIPDRIAAWLSHLT